MLIEYIGKKVIKQKCIPCGTRTNTYQYEIMRQMYLPSGDVKVFKKGKPLDIQDENDVKYLLGECDGFKLCDK